MKINRYETRLERSSDRDKDRMVQDLRAALLDAQKRCRDLDNDIQRVLSKIKIS